jgi:hypothetical protein
LDPDPHTVSKFGSETPEKVKDIKEENVLEKGERR